MNQFIWSKYGVDLIVEYHGNYDDLNIDRIYQEGSREGDLQEVLDHYVSQLILEEVKEDYRKREKASK